MGSRILLIGNYPADEQKSMSAFADMLVNNLLKNGQEVTLLKPDRVLLPANISRPENFWKWIAYLDKFVIFPFLLKRKAKKFDVIHICDHSNAMYAFWLKDKPTVATCHDVIAIEAAKGKIHDWSVSLTGKLFQNLIFSGLNQVDEVVCVSSYTQQHLLDLGWQGKRISVSLNALNADFYKTPDQERDKILSRFGINNQTKYLLHVGSGLSRKNRFFVIQVFKRIKELLDNIDLKLYFIGPSLNINENKFIENNNLTDLVSVVSDVNHDTLRAFYSGAFAFLFPSLYEGFGWPVIEAQSCECPVFCSNKAPMTEVGGEGAKYFDTSNVEEAAKLIKDTLPEINDLVKSGKANLERFSTEAMLSGYLSSYQNVIANYQT